MSLIIQLYSTKTTGKKANILLSNFDSIKYGTYGLRFRGSHQDRIAGIYSLGREKQISTSYDWNGLTRGENNVIVFQYTLKGQGEIRINDHTHRLEPGDAFFVKIPSDHRYALPPESKEWEFVHLTLFGDEAIRCFDNITEDNGNIIKLDLYSTPIAKMFEILKKVTNNQMNDAYEASALAYSFLMELQRLVLNIKSDTNWPESIANAILFIENHYDDPIILDDIVDASGISKYHFARLFHNTVHLTPIQYLTNTRINKSIELLKNDALTIDDIALKVGFSNGNYFIKVFRSSLGLPPGEYRNNKSFIPIDHFIRDH